MDSSKQIDSTKNNLNPFSTTIYKGNNYKG